MSTEAFDALHAAGMRAVLESTHDVDAPPNEGGRWGLSLVFVPTGAAAADLEERTAEAMALAGAHHWPTGNPTAVHITVRSMEPHRAGIDASDPLAHRCVRAAERAAEGVGALTFTGTGLIITRGTVMATLEPGDRGPDELKARLTDELGDDAWFERSWPRPRDLWYANIVHFAGPIDRPQELVAWVEERRRTHVPAEPITVDTIDVVTWQYDGRQVLPVTLASIPLA